MSITSTFIRNLRSIFVTALDTMPDSVHYAVLKTIDEQFLQVHGEINQFRLEICMATATGIYLDEWGSYFGIHRKPNENDDAYRVRIIFEITRPKVTKPSMEDWIREYLSERSNVDYPENSVEIKEPWKYLGRYSHIGRLSDTARMYSRKYWSHAVIDIKIPAEEELDENLRSLIAKIKAAGVKYYFQRNIYGDDTIVDASQWGIDNSFKYLHHSNLRTSFIDRRGEQLSVDAPLSGIIPFKTIYINNYTFFDVNEKGELMPKDDSEELKPYSDSELEEVITDGDMSPRQGFINDDGTRQAGFTIEDNDIVILGYETEIDPTFAREMSLDEDGDLTPFIIDNSPVQNDPNLIYFSAVNFGYLTTTEDSCYVDDDKYKEIEVLIDGQINPLNEVSPIADAGFKLNLDEEIEVDGASSAITEGNEPLFSIENNSTLFPSNRNKNQIPLFRYFELDNNSYLTLPEELEYYLEPIPHRRVFLSGAQKIWNKYSHDTQLLTNYKLTFHNIFSSDVFTMEEIYWIYNCIFEGIPIDNYYFLEILRDGNFSPKIYIPERDGDGWELTLDENGDIMPAAQEDYVDDDKTRETDLDERGDLHLTANALNNSGSDYLTEIDFNRLNMHEVYVAWCCPPIILLTEREFWRQYVSYYSSPKQVVAAMYGKDTHQAAYYTITRDFKQPLNYLYIPRLYYENYIFVDTLFGTNRVGNIFSKDDEDYFDLMYETGFRCVTNTGDESVYLALSDYVLNIGNINDALEEAFDLLPDQDLTFSDKERITKRYPYLEYETNGDLVLTEKSVQLLNVAFELDGYSMSESKTLIYPFDELSASEVQYYWKINSDDEYYPFIDKIRVFPNKEVTVTEEMEQLFDDYSVNGVMKLSNGSLIPVYNSSLLPKNTHSTEYILENTAFKTYIFDDTTYCFNDIKDMTIEQFENTYPYYLNRPVLPCGAIEVSQISI